jgi:hypothetical protein
VTLATGLLQIDFSENGVIYVQDEIQSGYWTHIQVTLFTAAFWIGGEGEEVVKDSFVVISDSMQHNKHSVVAFLRVLIDHIRGKYPELRNIDVISDGAASQFKNKYVMKAISTILPEVTDVRLNWHFSATSHGKGACDAIGAKAKQMATLHCKTRKGLIKTAQVGVLNVLKYIPGVSACSSVSGQTESKIQRHITCNCFC